jgi:hypothetical protein
MKKLKHVKLFENFIETAQTNSSLTIEPTLEIGYYEIFNSSTNKVIYDSEEGKQKNPKNIDIKRLLDMTNNVIDNNLKIGNDISKNLALKQEASIEGSALMKRLEQFLSLEGDYDHLEIKVYFKKEICLDQPSKDVIINKTREYMEWAPDLINKGCVSNIQIYLDSFVEFFENIHPEMKDVFMKYKIGNDDFVKKLLFISDIGIPVEEYLSQYVTDMYNNFFDYFAMSIGNTLEDL